MGKRIDPVIIKGAVQGRCPLCSEPFMGTMDADEEKVQLQCVSCRHIGFYFYRWPDELPKVTLRHVSNGRALGGKGRKKKRRVTSSDVLPGQLPLFALDSVEL